MAGAVDGAPPDRGDLFRLAAASEVLLAIAERVDGEIVDEALLAELNELRDRAHSALERLTGR
jgi:hypothetical protein